MSDSILDKIFSKNKWKNKYQVSWCDHCQTAIIECPKCKTSSCNGGGCGQCRKDFEIFFNSYSTKIEKYLTPSEIEVYRKTTELKKLITLSLSKGEKEINFKKLNKDGKLSDSQILLFWKFL